MEAPAEPGAVVSVVVAAAVEAPVVPVVESLSVGSLASVVVAVAPVCRPGAQAQARARRSGGRAR